LRVREWEGDDTFGALVVLRARVVGIPPFCSDLGASVPLVKVGAGSGQVGRRSCSRTAPMTADPVQSG
jgi:hypothetical protein